MRPLPRAAASARRDPRARPGRTRQHGDRRLKRQPRAADGLRGEVADDERTLRRARRVIWAFRLRVLTGTTDQGHNATVKLSDRRVGRIATTVLRDCGDGKVHPAPVETSTLAMAGDTFEVRRTWRERWTNGRMGTGKLHIRGGVAT